MKISDFYGNTFKWFVGIVKENDGGRVRVRALGIHPFEVMGQGDGSAYVAVSNGDLPYASIIYPVDSPANEHNLKLEDWVFGFFADGEACQQPVVVGRIGRVDGSPASNFIGDSTSSSSGGYTGSGTPGHSYISSGSGPNSQVNSENYYGYIPGDSNPQKAFNLYATFLEEEGIDTERAKQLAAGIIASLAGESGPNLNPGSEGDQGYSGGSSWGIAQWREDRFRALAEMCQPGDLECQLNYSISELKERNFGHSHEGKEARTLTALKKSNNAYEAAFQWTVKYEVPQNKESKGRERASNAENYYKQLAPNYQRATIGLSSSGKMGPR